MQYLNVIKFPYLTERAYSAITSGALHKDYKTIINDLMTQTLIYISRPNQFKTTDSLPLFMQFPRLYSSKECGLRFHIIQKDMKNIDGDMDFTPTTLLQISDSPNANPIRLYITYRKQGLTTYRYNPHKHEIHHVN